MSTLIESINGMMTPQLFGSLAARTGVSDTKVRTGMTAATGAVMEGIAGRARDPGAMNEIVRLIDQTPESDDPAHLIDEDAPMQHSGRRLLGLSTSDAPGMIKRLASSLGIGTGASASLLSAAAGIVLGGLRRFSRSRGGIDASSLSSTLIEETPSIRAMGIPPTVVGERVAGERVASQRVVHPAETVRLERPAKRSPLTWLLAAIPLVLIGIWLAKRPHRTTDTVSGAKVGEVVRESRDSVPRLEPPAIETPAVTSPEVAQTEREPTVSETGKVEYRIGGSAGAVRADTARGDRFGRPIWFSCYRPVRLGGDSAGYHRVGGRAGAVATDASRGDWLGNRAEVGYRVGARGPRFGGRAGAVATDASRGDWLGNRAEVGYRIGARGPRFGGRAGAVATDASRGDWLGDRAEVGYRIGARGPRFGGRAGAVATDATGGDWLGDRAAEGYVPAPRFGDERRFGGRAGAFSADTTRGRFGGDARVDGIGGYA